jgi:hypothetical protein
VLPPICASDFFWASVRACYRFREIPLLFPSGYPFRREYRDEAGLHALVCFAWSLGFLRLSYDQFSGIGLKIVP